MSSVPSTTSVQVELPDSTLAELDELARRKGITRTAALAQAVSTVKQLSDAEDRGAKIVVRDKV